MWWMPQARRPRATYGCSRSRRLVVCRPLRLAQMSVTTNAMTGSTSLPALLDIARDKFFRVLFEHGVHLVQQGVQLGLQLLAGLLRLGLGRGRRLLRRGLLLLDALSHR